MSVSFTVKISVPVATWWARQHEFTQIDLCHACGRGEWVRSGYGICHAETPGGEYGWGCIAKGSQADNGGQGTNGVVVFEGCEERWRWWWGCGVVNPTS